MNFKKVGISLVLSLVLGVNFTLAAVNISDFEGPFRLIIKLLHSTPIVFGFVFIFYFILLYGIYAAALNFVPVFKGGEHGISTQGKAVALSLSGLSTLSIFYFTKGSPERILTYLLDPLGIFAGIILAALFAGITYYGIKGNDQNKRITFAAAAAGFGMVIAGLIINYKYGDTMLMWGFAILFVSLILSLFFGGDKDHHTGGDTHTAQHTAQQAAAQHAAQQAAAQQAAQHAAQHAAQQAAAQQAAQQAAAQQAAQQAAAQQAAQTPIAGAQQAAQTPTAGAQNSFASTLTAPGGNTGTSQAAAQPAGAQSSATQTPSPNLILRGTVRDINGQPIDGATVDINSITTFTTTTDSNGFYEFQFGQTLPNTINPVDTINVSHPNYFNYSTSQTMPTTQTPIVIVNFHGVADLTGLTNGILPDLASMPGYQKW